MCGKNSDDEAFDLDELLNDSDVTPEVRRVLREVITSSNLPRRDSVLELIELATGRISGDEYRRILARHTHGPANASRDRSADEDQMAPALGANTWRRWDDVADIFNGPKDANWVSDRDLVSHEFDPSKKDEEARSTADGVP